jgi:hypothetical protein
MRKGACERFKTDRLAEMQTPVASLSSQRGSRQLKIGVQFDAPVDLIEASVDRLKIPGIGKRDSKGSSR